MPGVESLDDLEARLARQREDAQRWAAEYSRIRPDLYFVLRHSGRSGERWRVLFQSRSRDEAEQVYLRKAYPRRRPAITYAATRLLHGGTSSWDNAVLASSGDPPLDGSVPFAIDGEVKAAHEREVREARAARRARRRIAAPPARVPAVALCIAAPVDEHEAQAEHEAVEASDVPAVARHRSEAGAAR